MDSGSHSPRSLLPSLNLGLFDDPPQWSHRLHGEERISRIQPQSEPDDSNDVDDEDFLYSANYHSRNDSSPLILAAQNNDFQAVQELLTRGVPIDQMGLHGETALHMSSALGLVEIVRSLVQQGASVDLPDKEGSTPLLHCARFCHEESLASEISQYLVDNGASTTKYVSMGLEIMLPLSFAILHQNLPLVRELGPVTPLDFPKEPQDAIPTPTSSSSSSKKLIIVRQAISASVKSRDTSILDTLIDMGLPLEAWHIRFAPEHNTFTLLVDRLGLTKQQVVADAKEILRARYQGPRSAFPTVLKRLVEDYGADVNESHVRAFILSSGVKELLQAAIKYGLDLSSLSAEALKELSSGTPREFRELTSQLRQKQRGSPT